MTDEVICKIYQKDVFYTTPGTDQEKGNGLGLKLCMDLIESQNGWLKISSEPGKGSEFKIVLPGYPQT